MSKLLKIVPMVVILNSLSFCSNAPETQSASAKNNPTSSPKAQVTQVQSELSKKIKLPKVFKIDIFASNVDNARSMALGKNGTVFVGTRTDKVYAITDKNKDYKADEVITIAKDLNSPNGVAFKDGSLYVGEISKITRYDDIENKLKSVPKPVTITDKLPTETHHGWKYINFGPDGKLYVPVGAPCNICKSDDERFASITRMNADGSNPEVFAHGLRNSVGFDWNPENKSMWFTDNGRDMLGDDVPTDELNMADKTGMNFGYPYCHQGDVSDPQFGSEKSCSEFTKPASKLSPHAAALGMKFYTGNMFPTAYKKKVFIAEHGSWNRKTPIGYRIMTVDVENNKASNYKVFAEGWLTSSDVSGRPVDILNMPDGSILVSDDSANMIYRISYQG